MTKKKIKNIKKITKNIRTRSITGIQKMRYKLKPVENC